MTKRIRIPTAIVALPIAALALFGLLQPAFAAKDANNMPVTVRIPIEYRVDGEGIDPGADTYVLTPADETNPMPEGAKAGVKTIRIAKPGKTDFGKMVMTKPGAYDYTIHRIAADKKNIVKDNAVYRVRIAALNTGEASLIVKRDGAGEKSELIYKDTVKTGLFHTPRTGDPMDPTILIMLCASAAVIMIFLLVRARGRRFRQPRS